MLEISSLRAADMFGFGDIFGGGGGGGRGGGRRLRRGADLEYPLQLDFLEAAHGCEKQISVQRSIHCDVCSGTGLKDGKKPKQCGTCGGHGQVIQQQGFLMNSVPHAPPVVDRR